MGPARNFLIHLRLPFQLVLAPFMLFGAAIANGTLGWRFALGFVVLHVAFYGGTTAFNSHYDRDEGPIGGLERPPPPGAWLLPGSLLLQGVGLAAALVVGARFAAVCAVFALLGVAYSHPALRLKGKPLASWATVMTGQGALGAIAGIVAVDDARPGADLTAGVVASAYIVGALYPLSQVFQIDEDTRRGDRTVAIMLGRKGTPRAATALFTLGAAVMAWGALAAGRLLDAALFAAAPLPLGLATSWACGGSSNRAVFRRVAAFQVVASTVFGGYALARIVL
jgi:4-hydroxybenzoate polyprenyltransferase